jgi:hypothetical protein
VTEVRIRCAELAGTFDLIKSRPRLQTLLWAGGDPLGTLFRNRLRKPWRTFERFVVAIVDASSSTQDYQQ